MSKSTDKDKRAITFDEFGNKYLKRLNTILFVYRVDQNTTFDANGNFISDGDCLDSMMGVGRFYVYALLDPRTGRPFYIGKGFSNRAVDHFRLVGNSPDEIFAEDQSKTHEAEKIRVIRELISTGFTAKDIARVIARRVSEEVAFAIEALLIKSIYGRTPGMLTNVADGHHTERFRPIRNWNYIAGFDLNTDSAGNFIDDDGSHQLGQFYVYVLRNPVSGEIFYVGKGKRRRLGDHFLLAKSAIQDQGSDRLDQIRYLLNQGYRPTDIGRIVARLNSETLAFMIESFYIKFIVGFRNLLNIQPGHNAGLFRSQGDWQLRNGIDIPIVIEKGKARIELLDSFLAEGLDSELQSVVDILSERAPEIQLHFDPPRVIGAAELAVLSSIPGVDAGVKLRIQIRDSRRFQVMLYPANKSGKRWMQNHFVNLGAYPLKREDNMFIAEPWRGDQNMTLDANIAATRALQLIALTQIGRREDLNDIEFILNGLPYLG